MSHSVLLASQFSLVLPSAVTRHEWSGGQHPGWADVGSSRINIILQIITVVLSFKKQ